MIAAKAPLLKPDDFFSSPIEAPTDAEGDAEREAETRDGTRPDAVLITVVTATELATSEALDAAEVMAEDSGSAEKVDEGMGATEDDEICSTELEKLSIALLIAELEGTADDEEMAAIDDLNNQLLCKRSRTTHLDNALDSTWARCDTGTDARDAADGRLGTRAFSHGIAKRLVAAHCLTRHELSMVSTLHRRLAGCKHGRGREQGHEGDELGGLHDHEFKLIR